MSLLMYKPGSRYVTLDTLRTEVVTPEAMGTRHKPIPHHVLVDTILDQVTDRGWSVKAMKLGISAKGRKLFGIMDLEGKERWEKPEDEWMYGPTLCATFGFRSSTNETTAIRGVAGAKVMVCENMMMSGEEFVMRKKSTTRLNLPEAVSKGLDRFMQQSKLLHSDIEFKLKQRYCSDERAKVKLFDLFNKGALPLHLFDDVSRYYFQPQEEHPDCKPRTFYGLNNACTRAIQQLKSPEAQFNCAVNVGRHFELAVKKTHVYKAFSKRDETEVIT